MVTERRRLRARGIVQGVGFRPFVHGVATRHELAGFVLNDGDGVVIEVEGPSAALDDFEDALRTDAPPQARLDTLLVEALPAAGARGFAIRTSDLAAGAALLPPDLATCADCLRELFDPADRRYRYPFLNCTQCGPRLTIVESLPYDRERTPMAAFPMCDDCRREYEDPHDRRFHAEPTACPACGPRLSMPLDEAVGLLRDGAIVAVKGLGGWHLACEVPQQPRFVVIVAPHTSNWDFLVGVAAMFALGLRVHEDRPSKWIDEDFVQLRGRAPGLVVSVTARSARDGVEVGVTWIEGPRVGLRRRG